MERDGPLDEAAGLLPDLAQIFEALSFGFKETPPLSSKSIDRVVQAILLPLTAPDVDDFDPLIQAVTDFDFLAFRVAQVEQESSQPLSRWISGAAGACSMTPDGAARRSAGAEGSQRG